MSGRVGDAGYAERVNAAVQLVEAGVGAGEAARLLAVRFAVSPRQARRYVELAAASGRVPVPEANVVFTVKLPMALAGRVRAHALESGVTISALVTRALLEFLERGRKERRGR